MLPPGEYKRGAGWICHSDTALRQITLVLISFIITLGLTVLVVVVVVIVLPALVVVAAGSLEADSVDWASTWRPEPDLAGTAAADVTDSGSRSWICGSLRICRPSPDAELRCTSPSLA